mmetsp:Transcript_26799/g.58099  ORF Transcript_26799/g.58099 Transcript_26799/m.58099 type:complete len:89 (+) Transcript_26799:77-343(+)
MHVFAVISTSWLFASAPHRFFLPITCTQGGLEVRVKQLHLSIQRIDWQWEHLVSFFFLRPCRPPPSSPLPSHSPKHQTGQQHHHDLEP